jgi:hypothetical protein
MPISYIILYIRIRKDQEIDFRALVRQQCSHGTIHGEQLPFLCIASPNK